MAPVGVFWAPVSKAVSTRCSATALQKWDGDFGVRREAERHAALLNRDHRKAIRGIARAGEATGRCFLGIGSESGVDAALCHRTPKGLGSSLSRFSRRAFFL
jgi:hypothetical protein